MNDSGEVRNKLTGYILVGDVNSCDYPRVCLYNKNNTPSKQRFFRHRLVAEHFIPNPNNLAEVNHIDLNKNNNHISNLEWVTRHENEAHARRYGAKVYKPFKVVFSHDGVKSYHTTSELAEEIGVSRSSVKFWLHGKNKGYEKYSIKKIEYVN